MATAAYFEANFRQAWPWWPGSALKRSLHLPSELQAKLAQPSHVHAAFPLVTRKSAPDPKTHPLNSSR